MAWNDQQNSVSRFIALEVLANVTFLALYLHVKTKISFPYFQSKLPVQIQMSVKRPVTTETAARISRIHCWC